jgi:hypothetical protein
MANSFESRRGNIDEPEIIVDRFEFQSAGKKYINQNYKRIGSILGIEGEWLGNIKRQANSENKLPDIQGELTLDQINFYREHYDFPPLTQDEYDSIKSQNTSTEATIDGQSEEVVTEVKQSSIDANFRPSVTIDIPDNASTKLSPEQVRSTAESLYNWGNAGFPEGEGPIESIDSARNLVSAKGRILWTERIPGINDDAARNDRAMGRISQDVETMKAAYLQFYGVTQPEILAERAEVQSDEVDTIKRQTIDTEADTTKVSEGTDESPSLKGENLADVSGAEYNESTNPDSGELQSELSRLVTEAANELSKEQGGAIVRASDEASKPFEPNLDALYQQLSSHNINLSEPGKLARVESDTYPGEVELETIYNSIEINSVKEKALEAISDYQQFIEINRNNLRDEKIYNEYRRIEQEAWSNVGRFIHKLGGKIATLPQERDIQLAHPEVVDIKEYLVQGGKITLDEEDNITHLNIDGNIIELNKPRTIEELLKAKRPTHILYHSGNPISEDDPTKQNYRGLLIDGLNENTLKLIEGVLNRKEIGIVDETGLQFSDNSFEALVRQTPDEVVGELEPKVDIEPPIMPIFQVEDGVTPNFNTQEKYSLEDKSKQDPWIEESKGETEFEKIFADSLKNKAIQRDNEIRDPWLEKAVIEVPPIIPVFPISSGDNLNLQSEGVYPLGEEGLEATPKVSLDDLRLAYARAEEAYNRKRGSEELEENFVNSRDAYNAELERVLKLKVSEGQETNIHELFKNEVISLREQRITQSKELQGTWEKRFNNTKEKLLGWATKNKRNWMVANITLATAGGFLYLTGAGIPVAGALGVARRSLGSVMSGVGIGNTIVGIMEDRDTNINIFGKNIKFQAVIPKLVKESLSTNEDDFKKVSDDVLKDRLGTLEAYYRLNGGKFFKDDQQQAYEKVLTELARRVKENIIDAENNQYELRSDWQGQEPDELTDEEIENKATQNLEQKSPISRAIPFSRDREINKQYDLYNKEYEEWVKSNPERYTSELLNTISDKRVQELDKFRRNRKIATVAGIATTGILGGLLVNDMHRPGGMFNPNDTQDTGASAPKTEAGSGPGGAPTGESVTPKPTTEPISPNPLETPGTRGLGDSPTSPEAPPTGAGDALSQSEQLAQSAEATRAAAEQAAEQASEQLAQDVSNLTPRESIWTEVAKQLGEGATEAQIQQAVENILQSAEGQNSIYKLAQGTEGGRALLSQWGIDNASEMATLSKEQLYEISRYLAPGELQGITELSLDNLTPFEAAEPPQVDVSESMDTTTSTTEAPTSSVDPTPSAAPGSTPSPEAPPITSTEFTRGLSEALGTTNLTEIQVGNILEAYIENPQNKESLYYLILDNQQDNQALTNLLIDYGVSDIDKFVELSPDRMYKLAELVGVENLDKLPGFELNDIIISKFEDAPDSVELFKGSSALTSVNRYVAEEIGNLPYDSNLGKQVLDTYVQTDLGKQWLYDSIVNNPDVNNQNIQYFKEYLRFKDIKSPEEFVSKFNWSEFSGNKNIPTSGFWNQIRLPNGGTRLQPLSTFLKPSQMTGIKEAVRQVLTKQ